MIEAASDIESLASSLVSDAETLSRIVEALSSSSRKQRQLASSVIAAVASAEPSILVPMIDDLVDALSCKEAQTRRDILNALTCLVPFDANSCKHAFEDAEIALFDESNGLVRLAAMRFICAIGASSPEQSSEAWPLIEEAIQCFHGDAEFQEMLAAVALFAQGDIDAEVKNALRTRMSFDAQYSKGATKKSAQHIIGILG